MAFAILDRTQTEANIRVATNTEWYFQIQFCLGTEPQEKSLRLTITEKCANHKAEAHGGNRINQQKDEDNNWATVLEDWHRFSLEKKNLKARLVMLEVISQQNE